MTKIHGCGSVFEQNGPEPKRSEDKHPYPDHRIYVLLPLKVECKDRDGSVETIYMPTGRLIAQAAHVVSGMRVRHANRYFDLPITTIVYSVRNGRELVKLATELQNGGVEAEYFFDHGYEFYHTPDAVLTAVCTVPVLKDKVAPILGHLELFA